MVSADAGQRLQELRHLISSWLGPGLCGGGYMVGREEKRGEEEEEEEEAAEKGSREQPRLGSAQITRWERQR